MAKVTYGTGCFLLLNTGESPVESKQGLVSTVALQRGGRRTYALEGSVFIGGAAVQWLRDGLGIIASAGEVGALAAQVPAARACTSSPRSPVSARRTGSRTPAARSSGSRAAPRRRTSRAPRSRASPSRSPTCWAPWSPTPALTPTTCAPTAAPPPTTCCCRSRPTCSRSPVTRAAQTESTALGAALLAGLATGVWRDEAEAVGLWRAERTFAPDAGVDREGMLAGWRAAVACVRQFGRDAGTA